MNAISVSVGRRKSEPCAPGTPVGALLESHNAPDGLPFIAALVNNDVVSLSYPLTVNSQVEFLTMTSRHGWRVYRRSLCFLLAKAVRDLFPRAHFSVEHSFGLGLYCQFSHNRHGDGMTVEELGQVDAHMRELVARDISIERHKIAFMDAVRELETNGQPEKAGLLRHRNPPRIVVHACDGFCDLAHGPLVPSTGALHMFELIHYPPGLVIHLPDRDAPHAIPPFEDQPHLFQIYQEHKAWGRILGVTTVGTLNEIVARDEFSDFIMTAEALHEKKLAAIAEAIVARRDSVRVILIAGPSSAGKTTFAKRLTTHLRVNGRNPVTLSTDDYFVGEARNPRGVDGKPDYEHVEAVDLELFNHDLAALIAGDEIALPRFNFGTKEREYRNEKLRLKERQVLIVEGIHGLNPRLAAAIPDAAKFRIYVSALTQLSIDTHNRISTTDNRLMRRLVRDHRYRGHSALGTLRMWPMVRLGERTWIFPYQREADATFNSALDYELAVLKPFVEPLLMQVKPSEPEYAEARRLSEFLLNFMPADPALVPRTSILREYIGGSSLRYT
jgi:uridine kinase